MSRKRTHDAKNVGYALLPQHFNNGLAGVNSWGQGGNLRYLVALAWAELLMPCKFSINTIDRRTKTGTRVPN